MTNGWWCGAHGPTTAAKRMSGSSPGMTSYGAADESGPGMTICGVVTGPGPGMTNRGGVERAPQPMPNIFFQLFMACIHGFSAAGPWPQMSMGGFMPKIFS